MKTSQPHFKSTPSSLASPSRISINFRRRSWYCWIIAS